MIKISIWVERYRPQKFEDVIGLDQSIQKMVNTDMPNFLFVGPSGTGKTTTAKIIIKTLKADSLILNSSLDRKIETVREKVREFSRTMSYNSKLKIVFMDEADGLLPVVQEALRNVMETYSEYVRFIFTANNENKITDAIKSRSAVIRFVEPKFGLIYERLCEILTKEKCISSSEAVEKLVSKLYPDIRKMINELQKLTKNGTELLTIEKVNSLQILSQQILELIKKKDFITARETIYKNGIEYDLLFKELYLSLMNDPLYDITLKQQVNEIAKQSNYWMAGALYKEIALESFLFGLLKIKL